MTKMSTTNNLTVFCHHFILITNLYKLIIFGLDILKHVYEFLENLISSILKMESTVQFKFNNVKERVIFHHV